MSAPRRAYIVLLISFTAVLFLSGCATVGKGPEPGAEAEPEVSLEEQTYQGMSYYAATGNPDAAIAAFERARNENPDDPETMVLFSSLLLAVGRLEEARDTLESVLKEYPENINALYNLSLVEGAEGKRDAQRERLEAILAIDPEEPRANATMGELYLQREEYREARAAFERSIEADPGNLVARVGYGNVLRRTEAYEESVEQFTAAAELDPDYSFVYADRARSRLHLRDTTGAEEDLSRAIEKLPDHYWHYIDRGKVRLIDLGRPKEALEDFNRAVEINPDLFYAYVYRGGILIDLARYDEALEDLELVYRKRPDYYPVYPDLAMLYFLDEQWPKVRLMSLKSAEVDDENPGFVLMAGVSYYLEGSREEGRTYFSDMLNSFPRDSAAYHVARAFVEPGYEGTALRKVQDEKNLIMKSQMLFYLALFYRTHDMPALSQTLLLETADANILSLRETRLAREDLAAIGVNE
jgi:tetratricopeptide (TPR) repeat protein